MYLKANRKKENPEGSLTSSVMCHDIKGKEAMRWHRIPKKNRQSAQWNTKNTICSAQVWRSKRFPNQEQTATTLDLLIIMSSIPGQISKTIHSSPALTMKHVNESYPQYYNKQNILSRSLKSRR